MVTKKDYLDYLKGAEGLSGKELARWWEAWIKAYCQVHPTLPRKGVEHWLMEWCWLERAR